MKTYLSLIPLNSGGYTYSGQYFGVGEKLWYFRTDKTDARIDGYLRAPSRAAAKRKLLTEYPSMTFYK